MNAYVYKYYSSRPSLAVIIARRLALLILCSWRKRKQTRRSLGTMAMIIITVGGRKLTNLDWNAHTDILGVNYCFGVKKVGNY